MPKHKRLFVNATKDELLKHFLTEKGVQISSDKDMTPLYVLKQLNLFDRIEFEIIYEDFQLNDCNYSFIQNSRMQFSYDVNSLSYQIDHYKSETSLMHPSCTMHDAPG